MNEVKRLFLKIKALFEAYGDENDRDTFEGEFNYESGKLFFILLMTMVVWLPYIPNDIKLHQYPALAVSIRIGLSALSLLMIALKLTTRFRHRPGFLLMVLSTGLYFGTALVTATSGEFAASYIGGFAFVIMVPVFAPFPLKFKVVSAALALALFFGVGTLTEMDFTSFPIRYAVNDLISASVVSVLLSYIQHQLRFNAWMQRKKLSEMIVQNEKNLATIFSLASKAEAASKSKSEFLAKMSHEIRTPMNAILGISEIQMQRDDLNPDLEGALDKIHNSGQILLSIINDILDLSKIETGKLELNPAEYDIASLINDTASLNMVRIGSKPIEFRLDISEYLPVALVGDELRIKQILNNLLSNAFKYTEKGSVTFSVGCERADDGVLMRFRVADTGQGMKPEDLERLFTEYSRFNADANRATEGTGLGLSITKRLVELMGGTIEVESEYGAGSVFTVTIMQSVANGRMLGAELAEKLRGFSYTHKKRGDSLRISRRPMPYGRVLIVDDLETNLYVAEGLMAPYSLKIETALSGTRAIELVNAGAEYDIIFMDHMMPEMDGIEAVKRLRAGGYTAPIVALTANAISGNDALFKSSGFDDFISKPIDIRQLDDTLNRFVRRKHKNAPDAESALAAAADAPAQVEIKGVDTAEGIRNIGGVAEHYRRTLAVFCRDVSERREQIPAGLEHGDIKPFTTHVHAIKSAAASIGAKRLSALAKALESAAGAGDTDYIEKHVGDFLIHLEEVERGISEYLDKERRQNGASPAGERLFVELKTALESGAIGEIDRALARLAEAQPTGLTDDISQCVLLSDYDEAIKLIDDYLASRAARA